MQKPFSRLLLALILVASVSPVLQLPLNYPRTIAQRTWAEGKPKLASPKRLDFGTVYSLFQAVVNWADKSTTLIARETWGSFTQGLVSFEPLPEVSATSISLVQEKLANYGGPSSSVSVTLNGSPANGDYMVASIVMRSGGSAVHVSTVSQTGTTWTKAGGGNADPDYGVYGEIWMGQIGASASTSVTINFSSSSDYVVELFEFSGLSGIVDKTATNNGVGSTTDTGTATTTQTVELWFGQTWNTGTGSQSSPKNGFTLYDGANHAAGADTFALGTLVNIVSSSGTADSGATVSSTNPWAGCIVTLEAPTGPPAEDFAISASPTSQSIGAGGTASTTLTITFGSGFTGPVSFPSISGCPSGVTCTVSPSSITASGTATLNVPTLITTTGTYSVVVTAQASGGSPSHQVTFTVTVTAPPSFNFNVLSTNTQVIVTVTWTGTGTASVTIAAPGGIPQYSESGAVVYNRISYVSGVSPPVNVHRVTFTLSSPPAGVWTAYVSISGATVTIEVS